MSSGAGKWGGCVQQRRGTGGEAGGGQLEEGEGLVEEGAAKGEGRGVSSKG